MNTQESIYHLPDMHVTDPVDFFAETKGVAYDAAERELAWQQATTPEPTETLNSINEQQTLAYSGDQEAQVARSAAMAAFSRAEPVATVESERMQETQATPEQIMRTVGANLMVLRNNVLGVEREDHVVF